MSKFNRQLTPVAKPTEHLFVSGKFFFTLWQGDDFGIQRPIPSIARRTRRLTAPLKYEPAGLKAVKEGDHFGVGKLESLGAKICCKRVNIPSLAFGIGFAFPIYVLIVPDDYLLQYSRLLHGQSIQGDEHRQVL